MASIVGATLNNAGKSDESECLADNLSLRLGRVIESTHELLGQLSKIRNRF